MKTTKQTFAALFMIAALVLFSGGFLAYSQGRPTPTPPIFPDCTQDTEPPHKCTGSCPTLWAPGTPNAVPVQPYTDRTHPDPCFKWNGGQNCTCSYRYEPGGTFYCHNQDHQCDGGCPNLYRTPQDAQNGTMPVDFANHPCKKDSPTVCACYYY